MVMVAGTALNCWIKIVTIIAKTPAEAELVAELDAELVAPEFEACTLTNSPLPSDTSDGQNGGKAQLALI